MAYPHFYINPPFPVYCPFLAKNCIPHSPSNSIFGKSYPPPLIFSDCLHSSILNFTLTFSNHWLWKTPRVCISWVSWQKTFINFCNTYHPRMLYIFFVHQNSTSCHKPHFYCDYWSFLRTKNLWWFYRLK